MPYANRGPLFFPCIQVTKMSISQEVDLRTAPEDQHFCEIDFRNHSSALNTSSLGQPFSMLHIPIKIIKPLS